MKALKQPRGLRGSVLSFSAAPEDLDSPGVDYLDDAVVLLADGRIESVEPVARYEQAGGDLAALEDLRGSLIVPGFIDTHIHYSQMASLPATARSCWTGCSVMRSRPSWRSQTRPTRPCVPTRSWTGCSPTAPPRR
jgi:hypothetical protein